MMYALIYAYLTVIGLLISLLVYAFDKDNDRLQDSGRRMFSRLDSTLAFTLVIAWFIPIIAIPAVIKGAFSDTNS